MGEANDWLAKFNNTEYDLDGTAWTVFNGATYVSCFAEQPDQLSQWRAYGGRGYSVGFTRDGLNKLKIDGEDKPFESAGDVIKVGYGEPGLEELRPDVSNFFATRLPIGTGALGDSLKLYLSETGSSETQSI
jgi:hypothetical protein